MPAKPVVVAGIAAARRLIALLIQAASQSAAQPHDNRSPYLYLTRAGLLASLAANGMPADINALEPTLALAQTCGALATLAKGAMTALPYQRDLHRQI